MIELESYLNGEWKAGTGKKATLKNPATGEAVAETSTSGLDFAAALTYARDVGGPALRAMTFAERGAMLKEMSKALHEVRDELIEASIINAGTTLSDSKFDIDGATGTLAYYAGVGKRLGDRTYLVEGEGEQLTRGARFWGHHLRVPRRGVALHINAFNFPAWGLAEKAACALLAGMPVVTKPATSTILPAYRLMKTLVDAKVLPDGALSFVCGSAGDLVTHLGPQDVLAFTGSGDTGAMLRRMDNVIERSVRVNVEADSLNAMVLGEDVEAGSDTYQMFIRHASREITQKTGQKCTATRRVFVPEAIIDRVIEDLGEALSVVTVGNPHLDEVRMGPLSNEQQHRDVRAGMAKLIESGCKVVWGDPEKVELIDADADRGCFVGPVLLRNDATGDSTLVHELEVFGPVSTIMPYASLDEGISLVARGEGGL
ncbi:MAG: 3,4-dehydroadipyl-CoA semialdehyde dehydrogenase, partial [Deltaproteobacteria bacterium]|nr:3,4-dehydroadipyl-CoA semialdehyde dehydrogenase [Deltaproteobacteria bacterium]